MIFFLRASALQCLLIDLLAELPADCLELLEITSLVDPLLCFTVASRTTASIFTTVGSFVRTSLFGFHCVWKAAVVYISFLV